MDKLNIFTTAQGLLLIKLLLAHLVGDFVLQHKKMVENKKWLSKEMFVHIIIVYLCTAIFSGLWLASILIAVSHYFVDGLKVTAKQRNWTSNLSLFIIDQFLHFLFILVLWIWYFNIPSQFLKAISLPISNFSIGLILLGYMLVIGPLSYIIELALQNVAPPDDATPNASSPNEHGGKRIGIFERIIILTFVLLGQYEAIGFLITGKSIIRFANSNEHIRSEYVLVGTMISYAITIVIGVLLRWLLHV